MWGFFYDRSGEAVGFRSGEYIYTMSGDAIAFIQGTHVHKLSGPYVGELHRDMVVNEYLSNPGSIGHVGNPGKLPRADNPGNRGPMDYGYPDVFHKLFESDD